MAAEAVEEEMERFSGRRHGYPRDLLQRLGSTSCYEEKEEFVRRDSDEIELSLGLSLGGCFGEETKEKGGLVRSSSIASMSMMGRELEFTVVKGIARASSLPAETEEDLRKRKEIQSLKRLEAKRKRLERMTSRSMVGVGRDRSEESVEEEVERSGVELGGNLPTPLTRWPANGAGGFGPVSQRSIGSQGSCSSVVSELDTRVAQGLNSRCAHSIKPRPDGMNHKIATVPVPATVGGKRINCSREGDDPMQRNVRTRNGLSEMEKSMMQEMPCVSTRGDGPDGRRIEGFLYKYRKGEDVRIVCICHGKFLTPAEFVKHAGGGDVAHPLRHIVVSQFPYVFL